MELWLWPGYLVVLVSSGAIGGYGQAEHKRAPKSYGSEAGIAAVAVN